MANVDEMGLMQESGGTVDECDCDEMIHHPQHNGESCPNCERITVRDDAIDVVARHVVTTAYQEAINYLVEWADYPKIGEHDWKAVVERAHQLVENLNFGVDEYKRAYELLDERAEHSDA